MEGRALLEGEQGGRRTRRKDQVGEEGCQAEQTLT